MNKKLMLGLLGTTGVVATLAYTAGNQPNRLSDEQMDFTQYQSQNHENQLTAEMWDTVMGKLTTWVQNHEPRLQVFADNTNCGVLNSEDISFTDMLSTKHNNQLTSGMWNGLMNRLEKDIQNHECRLRKEPENPVCEGMPGRRPSTSSECVVSNPNQLTVNESNSSTFVWFWKTPMPGAYGDGCNNVLPDRIYKRNNLSQIEAFYYPDGNGNEVVFRATNAEVLDSNNEGCFELYALTTETISPHSEYSAVYKKYTGNYAADPINDVDFICSQYGSTCKSSVGGAKCELKTITGTWPSCSYYKSKDSCKSTSGCRWGYWTRVE